MCNKREFEENRRTGSNYQISWRFLTVLQFYSLRQALKDAIKRKEKIKKRGKEREVPTHQSKRVKKCLKLRNYGIFWSLKLERKIEMSGYGRALEKVSKALNHNRVEISLYYLGE